MKDKKPQGLRGPTELYKQDAVDPRFNGLMRREPCPLL